MRYEHILQNLDQALAFCESIGLGSIAKRGRFADYHRRIARLIKVRGMRPFPQDLIEHLGAYLTALTESMEFGNLLPYLQQCDPARVGPKLRDCLQGALLPSATEDKARNIQFELLLAHTLWQAGFQPLLGEHPDLTCAVDGTWFFFECKRLLSPSPAALKKRIQEAGKQLRQHWPTTPHRTQGIVAVSLSRVLNPSQEPLPSQDESSAREELAAWLWSKFASVRDVSVQLSQKKISGILFHAASSFENFEMDRFDFGQYFLGASHDPEGTPADNAVLRLVAAMKAVRY